MQYDWTTFTKRIPVHASVADVYAAWATRGGIESWFLRTSEFTTRDGQDRGSHDYIQEGDQYTWRWHGWGDEVTHHGSILDANGQDRLAFTFDAGNKSNDMQVRVSLNREKGQTIVELTQYHIPTDEESKFMYHIGCMEGWTFYLANLKSILEGGIDLRNKDVEIKKVINS